MTHPHPTHDDRAHDDPADRPVTRIGPAATLVLLAVAAGALLAAGGRLPFPPVDPTRLVGWFGSHGPALAVAGALRALSLAAVAYLAGLVVLGSLLRTGGHGPAVAARLPSWLGRRLLEQAVGVGVVTGVGLTLSPGAAMAGTAPPDLGPAATAEQPPDTILMIPVDDVPAPSTTVPSPSPRLDPRPSPDTAPRNAPATPTTDRRSTPDEPTATMTALDEADAPAGEAEDAVGSEAEPGSEGAVGSEGDVGSQGERRPTAPGDTIRPITTPSDAGVADGAPTWRVELGDHLWGIAAETLADHGVPVDDTLLLDYWARLLDANRGRLVDPDNPDLLFPGQVLVLPALSAG